MKKLLSVTEMLFLLVLLALPLISTSQNIGIGTNLPLARLHVADSSVVFSATGDVVNPAGNPPIETAGRRMMWYPDKAAFRVGYSSSTNDNLWTKNNIGYYSFATGQSTNASGLAAFATGSGSKASGNYSVALGSSISTGTQATASGNSTASGLAAVALGGANASGSQAVAIGFAATASGNNSFALGTSVTASGTNSMALGSYVSTSGFDGALTIGDNSTTTVMNTFVANGFRSRFAGGYRLFTNSDVNIGAFLNAGANSWAALSDARLKENFRPVDGESFLQKIAKMPLTSWNYKTQDPLTFRHYGPMAQDFYKAFGKDELGEIGCDTLINQQDFLGVNLIAIQALEKRTAELSNRLEMALALINIQTKEIDLLKEQNKNLSISLNHK